MVLKSHRKTMKRNKISKENVKDNKKTDRIKTKSVNIKTTSKKKNGNIKEKKQKRDYTAEALEKAVEAVNKGMSYRKAANMYQVPVTCVFRVVKNPIKQRTIFIPPTVLSLEEEQEIVNWILYRARIGFPATKSELLDCVQSYVLKLNKQTPFTNGRPGRHWYEAFFKRHPNLTTRTAQHLTENLREWFAEVRASLESKNLVNIHPSRVFNCNETNIQLLPKPEKVLTNNGARSVYKVVDANEKESLTVLFMYSADGTRAPPMIMYRYKDEIPLRILTNFPEDFGIGHSDNGWMTAESFYEYVTNIFYPWLISNNIEFPVVIYLDGHSSHINMPLVSFCLEKQIELVILFPNATNIIQPHDISVFHPFKETWRKIVPKWKAENNISRMKLEHFAIVLKETLNLFKAEKKCVRSGFRASGLMPFNPDAIDYNVLQKGNKGKLKNYAQENQELEKEDKKAFLKAFGKAYPVDELLQNFKEAKSSV